MSVALAEKAASVAAPPTRNIRQTRLSNGLLVLTESMPHLRSVSMGVWVASGSRDEQPARNGISHFVEHMLFKGTATRSAAQIARDVDAIGGNLDAFTSKESICFYIKVLDENIQPALDVLADLVLHPTFAEEELRREQDVILEEIKMDEDNPDYLVHELFTQNFWRGDALGLPILGTAKTVRGFTRDIVQDEYAARFIPANLVFSAAGNLDHDSFVAQVEHYFSGLAKRPAQISQAPQAPAGRAHITLKNKKSLEQVQLCMGVSAIPVADPKRYAVYLLNTILGGGMSSRLFQTIREEQGLAYSIYSEMNPFRDTGSLCVYAGASADKTERLVQLTLNEFRRIKESPVTEEELRRAKDQLKGNIVLGLESSSSRMSNLARQQIYFGRFFSINEITADIDRVTREDLQELAQALFRPEAVALAVVGNLDGLKFEREDLAC